MNFDLKKYNDLNTTVGTFLLNAIVTAFTCGVVLGVAMWCGLNGREPSASMIEMIRDWLVFVGAMWGAGVTQFGIKRQTHKPWGAQGESGRPSTAVPAIPPSTPGV